MPFLKTVNFRGVKRNTCKSLKLSEITGGISSYFFENMCTYKYTFFNKIGLILDVLFVYHEHS